MKTTLRLTSLALAALLAVGVVKVDAALHAERNYGRDRIKTAEYVADSLNPHKDIVTVHPLPDGQGVPTVLVNQYSFQDGLTAHNFVQKYNARLLLITPDYANVGLSKNFFKSDTIYLLGGPKEITPKLEKHLKKYFPKVIRVKGNNVYERNREALKMTGFKDVGVVDGRKFPDGLSAAGLLAQKNMGLLLVDGSKGGQIPQGINTVYTIGGVNSVKETYGKRLAGEDRYKTGIVVGNEAQFTNILLVDGRNYADSISAINLAKPRKAIIAPIRPKNNSDIASAFLNRADTLIFIGGFNSISEETYNNFRNGH